jgi:hypothetical protein
MANKFAAGQRAISECDRCGQRYKLKQLRELVIRTKKTNILVCPTCWESDHPQNMQGMYPVEDPQALKNPRPDNTYLQSGLDVLGFPSMGSRQIQWGWNPVGMGYDGGVTPNNLVGQGQSGTVTIIIGEIV